MDHTFPEGPLDVSVTLSPAQKVVGPDTVITGAGGMGFTVTTVGSDTDVHPKMFVRLTV